MAMAGHGHDFSDDDLDDIPLGQLAELEHHAIQFTQAANNNTQAQAEGQAEGGWVRGAPSSDYGDDFDDEDLDDAVVIDESRSTPAAIPAHSRTFQNPSQRETALPRHLGNSSSRQRPDVLPFQPSRTAEPPRSNSIPVRQSSQHRVGDAGPPDLLRELEELRRKNQALEQSLNVKAGEVAIVRSKQEKEGKEHERGLNALRKLNEEKLARQRKELEAARIAANTAATERDFVKQDLAESERVRRLNKAAERKDLAVTPKKKKTLPHRDGFDDDEIEILSPSKLSPTKFRPRTSTPSKASKRKRKAAESPAPALDIINVDEPLGDLVQRVSLFDEAILATLEIQDDRFDFLGTMLDHRPSKGHIRTIEALGKYSLPSMVEESLASIILGKIPLLGLRKPTAELPIDFCQLLVSLWARCFEEKYLEPLYMFVDILTLALELKTLLIAPQIIDTMLPVLDQSAMKVLTPRFYRNENKYPMEGYDKFVNVTSCLALLYITALGCMPDLEHITRFWRLMTIDTVLTCLSQNQTLEDFELMLKILSTSILKDSFGPVSDTLHGQSLFAEYIIDRLGYPLYEIPYLAGTNQRLEHHAILKQRLEILRLLTSMTRSPFASRALAMHQTFIARLVCQISNELDSLYDWRAGHESSARIITLATRILYHLVTTHDSSINMQQKLTQIPGGSQKYLLALSRLNFSEDDLLIESEVGADIPGMALEMLEMSVTPEEGDEIFGAFLGP